MNYIYRSIAVGVVMSCAIGNGGTVVHKLFQHGGNISSTPAIELGSIVLYLDDYPKMVKSKVKKKDKVEESFFLPEVEVKSKEVVDAIERINKNNDPCYSVAITQPSLPQKGLKITITYNDQQVGVVCDRFDSISLQKALIFRLYNQAVISKIKDTHKPIIQMVCNTPPKIIIDCGHGGADTGAVGYYNAIEKEINLQVGLQVAHLLKQKNIPVYLTRERDQTLLLDERTTFANRQQADLFISIHANAAPNKQSCGIETYCLSDTLFTAEGADTVGRLFAQQLEYKYAKSQKLAHTVHQSLLSTLPAHYKVHDRHVKHNVAQVLVGTTMPAILVEIGYVTHEQEARLLTQKDYQASIAEGIVRGINTYLIQTVSA